MNKQLCIFSIAACISTAAIGASAPYDNADRQLAGLDEPMTSTPIEQQTTTRPGAGVSDSAEEFSAFEDIDEPTSNQVDQRSDSNIRGRDVEHSWTPEEWYRTY